MKQNRIVFILLIMFLMGTVVSYTLTVNVSAVKEYVGSKNVYNAKKGRPDRLSSRGKPTPDPNPSIDKWAVVIGISDYKGKTSDLLYCDDDAMDMYNYLIEMGYPEGNIRLLLDKGAKASAIMDSIDWLSSWEGSESEVVFFFSGHGSTWQHDDEDTELYDEAIISWDLHSILDGQLRQGFADFESQKIVFIFDSCYAGGMDDLVGAWTNATISGRIVVTACGEEELGWEGNSDQQNGVFTYYFTGFSGAGLQTYNTIEEAFDYAMPLAHDFMQESGIEMNPQIYDEYLGNWTF